jgi:hypothetical protein
MFTCGGCGCTGVGVAADEYDGDVDVRAAVADVLLLFVNERKAHTRGTGGVQLHVKNRKGKIC